MKACLIVGALLCLAARQAVAAPEDWKAHSEEAAKAFNLGEFDRASKEYRAAYEIRADPSFLYNIAQSYRLGNNLQQALFFYRSYLHNEPEAVNRGEVENRIRKLEEQLASQHAVTNEPPNTTEPRPSDGKTTPAPPRSAVTLTAAPPSTATKPAYKRWWLWTAVGVVVVGAGLGVGLGLGLSHSAPSSQLGNTGVF